MKKILHPKTVYAGMATVPGREKTCDFARDSLLDQKPPGIKQLAIANQEMIGRTDDARKLFGILDHMDSNGRDGFVLLCDDDLKYPREYTDYMVRMCRLNKGRPVSLMARILHRESSSYYEDREAFTKYDWRRPEGGIVKNVDVPGSGVLCFHTASYEPRVEDMVHLNCLDLQIGLDCARQGVEIMRVPPPRRNWVEYMVPATETIYATHRLDCEIQTELANEIYRTKNESR